MTMVAQQLLLHNKQTAYQLSSKETPIMTDVVLGEASESDDEQFDAQKKVFALEVSGEATESDEDVYEQSVSTSEAREALSTESMYRNNLLQRKLIETNIAIWKSLNAFVKNFVISASKQLLSTDQMLLKSQVTMQAVLGSLKGTQTNVRQLHEKASGVFTTNFIPKITIKN